MGKCVKFVQYTPQYMCRQSVKNCFCKKFFKIQMDISTGLTAEKVYILGLNVNFKL